MSHPVSLVSAAQYFASTMIIVGLSVVVTVIVLQYHHHDPDGGKMPKWVRSSALHHRKSGAIPRGGSMDELSILKTHKQLGVPKQRAVLPIPPHFSASLHYLCIEDSYDEHAFRGPWHCSCNLMFQNRVHILTTLYILLP